MRLALDGEFVGHSNIEGFNYAEDFVSSSTEVLNTLDGSVTFKFGMSLGFFDQ